MAVSCLVRTAEIGAMWVVGFFEERENKGGENKEGLLLLLLPLLFFKGEIENLDLGLVLKREQV